MSTAEAMTEPIHDSVLGCMGNAPLGGGGSMRGRLAGGSNGSVVAAIARTLPTSPRPCRAPAASITGRVP
jgi:hypothetical protein